MLRYVLLVSALLFSVNALSDSSADEIKFNVKKIPTSQAAQDAISQAFNNGFNTEPTYSASVDIKSIVNLGKEVWKVVEAGKPVVDIQYDYASALPLGVTNAQELAGFSDVHYESYRLSGSNLYGMEVFNVVYTLAFRNGGSYEGNGQYLEAVTVLPQHVDVLWGYTLNMGVKTVSVVNVGSSKDPVGGLSLESTIHVSTVVKDTTFKSLFSFRGDSNIVQKIK